MEKEQYRKSNRTSRTTRTRAKIEKWNQNDNPEKGEGEGGGRSSDLPGLLSKICPQKMGGMLQTELCFVLVVFV